MSEVLLYLLQLAEALGAHGGRVEALLLQPPLLPPPCMSVTTPF